jgi:hypothetical protein
MDNLRHSFLLNYLQNHKDNYWCKSCRLFMRKGLKDRKARNYQILDQKTLEEKLDKLLHKD